jgi:hypothetical protein
VLLNAVKTDFVDHFVIFSYAVIPISHPSLKFFIYLVLGALIFISLCRFKSVIPFLFIYCMQALYLLIHYSYALYFDVPFHACQFILDFSEGILLARHGVIPMNIKYLAIIADLPLAMAIVLNYPKINQLVQLNYKMVRWMLWSFFIFLACFIPFSCNAYRIVPDLQNPWISEMEVIDKIGLLGNDIMDFLSYRGEAPWLNKFKYGRTVISRNKTPGQFRNVICIQVESLDANVINAQYKNQYVVPFLHRLSNESVYYPHTIFYRFAGASSDTEFTVLNGILPLKDYPSFKLRNYRYPNSILKLFLRSGFATIAFHNNVGDFFNRKVAYFKMGFQSFDDRMDMHLQERGWGASDHEMMGYIKKEIKKQKTPFFYYIVTMSSHEPFTNAGHYYHNSLYDDIKSKGIRDYFSSFSYVDNVLNDFITFVKNNFKDTYIFIYGDHNAYIRYDPVSFQNRGVPLFIITPDNKKYREDKEIASMLDLAPTILAASGINFKITVRGADLLHYPIDNGSIAVNDCRASDRDYLFDVDLAPQIHTRCS